MASSGSSWFLRSSPTSPHMPAVAAIATHATESQAGLRRDIRELGVLLGRTLVRQEGQELLDRVEEIRRLIRSDRDSAATLLAEVEPVEATKLVRAFTTFFHLANVAEQVHRTRELQAMRRESGGWLAQATARIAAAGVAARLDVRPVFTAHPTEAARRTVLTKIRQIGALLDERVRTVDDAADRRWRARLEELVELLWQTDELRIARP